MNRHPVALAIALAFSTSLVLPGCDRTSNLTEQEHIQRAKDFEDKGDLMEGVIELKNAIQKNPDNAQARLLLGQIYLKLGQGNEAEKEFEWAEKLGINSESVKLQLGKAWLLMGQHKRVLEEINPSIATSQKNKAAILQMQGDAMLGQRKLEEGCQLYKDSLAADSGHAPAYWGLANCSLSNGNVAEARAMLDAAIKANPTDAESLVVLGNFERLNENLPAALAAYTTALKHDPAKLGALFGRAQILSITGKASEARDDLEKIRKYSPNYFGIHFVEATLHYAAGKPEQAMESVQRALKINPGFMPAQLLLGMTQYDRKSYEQAAKVLGHYLELLPGHIAARKLLAATHLKLGQPKQALDLLKPYIMSGKADAQILALAGEAHLKEDDPSQAKDSFEKAVELVPASATLRTGLALSHLAAGKEDEAVRELEATSAMGGKDPKADIALAYYFLSERQFDKALSVLSELEKKLPRSPGTYNLKGMAYAGKNDFAQARKNFERALELKPDLASAAIRLAGLDLREKNIPAARNRYESILKIDKNNVPAMVGLAELASAEKKESEYLSWLEKGAKVSPSAFVPRAILANHYLGKHEPQKALAIAREAAEGSPGSPEALGLLGRTQLAAGEKENALVTYTRLTGLAPKSAPAHYGLAQAHEAMGDEKATRAELTKAIEIQPDYIDALAVLSALETRAGRHTESLRFAREVQLRAAASPFGFILEGDALMAERKYGEAAGAYSKALAKGKDSRLIIKLHQAQTKSGDTKNADDMLLGWIKTHPQDQISRAYLAENYARHGLRKEAIAQYELLVNTAPNNAIVLNNLALLYQQQRDPRALPMAEKVHKLNPESPSHADTLGWILVQQGQHKRGLQLLEKAVAGSPSNPEIRFHYASALANSGQSVQARKEIARLRAMKLNPELEQQLGQLMQRLP